MKKKYVLAVVKNGKFQFVERVRDYVVFLTTNRDRAIKFTREEAKELFNAYKEVGEIKVLAVKFLDEGVDVND